MSPLHAALLAVVLGWPRPVTPPNHRPETPEEYEARAEAVASSIALEARSVEEAAAVLVLVKGKSRMDALIHTGLVHPTVNQDHGRARCLTQLHRSRLVPDWDELTGTDLAATRRCIAATLRVLRSAARMCAKGGMVGVGDMERVFSAYATGRGCTPIRLGIDRALQWQRVRARLWRAGPTPGAVTSRGEQ